MQRLIYQTELSVAFLRNGKILVYKNDSNQYTLLPRYTIGIRDGNDVNLGKNEVGPFLFSYRSGDESEYKKEIALAIGKVTKNFSTGTSEEFLVGNANKLTDMGELTDNIYPFQVQEMIKKSQLVPYIRDGRNTFYLNTLDGIEAYENVGFRYLLLENGFENTVSNVSFLSFEELQGLTKTKPDDCSLELLVAMRELNSDKVQRFINEVVKERSDIQKPKQLDGGEK